MVRSTLSTNDQWAPQVTELDNLSTAKARPSPPLPTLHHSVKVATRDVPLLPTTVVEPSLGLEDELLRQRTVEPRRCMVLVGAGSRDVHRRISPTTLAVSSSLESSALAAVLRNLLTLDFTPSQTASLPDLVHQPTVPATRLKPLQTLGAPTLALLSTQACQPLATPIATMEDVLPILDWLSEEVEHPRTVVEGLLRTTRTTEEGRPRTEGRTVMVLGGTTIEERVRVKRHRLLLLRLITLMPSGMSELLLLLLPCVFAFSPRFKRATALC